MTTPVRVHPDAADELSGAYAWYLEKSPTAAAAFLAEIDRSIEMISRRPAAWPAHSAGTRRYVMRRFPFSIAYRELNDEILILAFAHARRRPGYWRVR